MIQGNRITLRLLRDSEECKTFVAEYNQLAQRAQTDHTEIKSATTLLKQFERDGLWGEHAGTLAIASQEGLMIGTIGFSTRSEFELEIGYRLLKSEQRGKGYGSEALALFAAYLFATKSIRRLRIQTASDNIGSQKVAEKCGFKREGVLRQAYFYRGRVCDCVMYGLLRDECPDFS